ncbi:MAG TPA: hypothetical protein VK009_21985 [Chloroflexota bacterium]|nr:hypothetical protein [Chloroflexota bacterium]
MKTTRYFDEQVLRKRPYLTLSLCERVVLHPDWRETQPDGRLRYWAFCSELDGKALRVITLEDQETIHNAFPDRNFTLERLAKLKAQ